MNQTHTETWALAETIFRRFRQVVTIHNYSEILALQGLARMGTWAKAQGQEAPLTWAVSEITPYLDQKIEKVHGAFALYRTGGNGAAWLMKEGHLPGRKEMLVAAAEDLLKNHPRSATGLFSFPGKGEAIWVDAAFAVCPFLAHVGLAAGRREFVDEAIRQIMMLRGLLLDGGCGLFHQAIGFSGEGVLSQDHWSRGNGWAAIALAEIACELPENHPFSPTLKQVFADFLLCCLKAQGPTGLWHQEMNDPHSFVETSGSGLILYGLGRALEKKIIPESHRAALEKGLRAYLAFISPRGDVGQTCVGCCSPGDGTVAAYVAHKYRHNDEHAFGPALMAFAQAHMIGIKTVGQLPTGNLEGN